MSARDHADAARPWWASADPTVGRLAPDEDPLDAITSARQRAGDGSNDEPDLGPEVDPAEGEAGASDVCGVCPLCTGWRYVRQHHPDAAAHLAAAGRHLSEAHPEVVDHLAAAGRHLAAALREVVDGRGPGADDETGTDPSPATDRGQRARSADRERFERIDLDDGRGPV